MLFIYLGSIVLANLLITELGPSATPYVAFVLVGLDLTGRDVLHQRWERQHLIRNMGLLIATGSLISYGLNQDSQHIALASGLAFGIAALADTAVFQKLKHASALVRINGSNIPSAILDSVLFIGLAFGTPLAWGLIGKQILAKVGGGIVWSILLKHD